LAVGFDSLAFVAAAVVSLGTSWVLVSRLERLGERLGLSEALLGLLAALAADTPEITSAITALVHHERAVGAGVVIGSNVFNLAGLLGLGTVVAGRVTVHRKAVAFAGAVALWVAVVCLAAVGGAVGPDVGLGMVLLVFVPYVLFLGAHRGDLRRWMALPQRWVQWLSSAVDEEELDLAEAIRPQRGEPRDVLMAAVSLIVVVGASVTMERASSALGRHYAVPGIIVGGLVLAAVTSLPNAVAAVYLAAKGRGAAMMSTALNSNSLNVIAGLLVPAVVIGMPGTSGSTRLIGGWYVGLTVLTLTLAYADRGLRRQAGWVIIGGYAAFVAALVAVS
jgi:cation:H+ antiporter